ncbi:MAG: phospholipase D-like domain-containing protein, partial [Thiohalomonadales bacterium]
MKHFTITRYKFPVREGNYFQLLVDGQAFFTSMLNSIETAKQFILLEQYVFESGYIADLFIDALIVAKGRGVAVYIIVDDYGGKKLKTADRRRMREAGLELQFFNPVNFINIYKSLFRDHRKILIVDHNVVYVGGAGISDDFDTSDIRSPNSGWHDVMLEIRGPVILDWINSFR